MNKRKLAAAVLALAQPHAAIASTCVAQQDLADTMIYVMPVAFEAYKSKCSASLSDTGFVAREGDAFMAKYQALHGETWGGAYRFIKNFVGNSAKDKEMANLFDAMPAESASPFFDAIIKLKLAEEIKVKDCAKIERILEPLAPLPARNMGTLVATALDLAPENPKLKICPLETQ